MERLESEFTKAMVLRDEGRFAEAVAIVERLLLEHPDDKRLFVGLGSVHVMAGNHEEARKAFAEAVRLAPDSELVSADLFLSLLECGMEDEAFREMTRFLRAHPESKEYKLIIEEFEENSS